MSMTLDEAIQYCEAITVCDESKEEHLQLLEWLKELKELKNKKGKWTIPSELCKLFDIYECSACKGRGVLTANKYKYCPNCGAEMEEYKE